jgi:hypothetical protein
MADQNDVTQVSSQDKVHQRANAIVVADLLPDALAMPRQCWRVNLMPLSLEMLRHWPKGVAVMP